MLGEKSSDAGRPNGGKIGKNYQKFESGLYAFFTTSQDHSAAIVNIAPKVLDPVSLTLSPTLFRTKQERELR